MSKSANLKPSLLHAVALLLGVLLGPTAYGQGMSSMPNRQGAVLNPAGNCSFTYCWAPQPGPAIRSLPAPQLPQLPQMPAINPIEVEMTKLINGKALGHANNSPPNLGPTPGLKLSENYPLADNAAIFAAGADNYFMWDKYGHPWFTLDGKAKTVSPGYAPQPGETVTTDENAGLVTANPKTGQVVGIESNTRANFSQDADGHFLIELAKGALRAVTGWIEPKVSVWVVMNGVTYPIGIRGTDYKVSADTDRVCALVLDGAITMAAGTALAFDIDKGEAACAGPASDWTFQKVDFKDVQHLTRRTRVDGMVERAVKMLPAKAAMVGKQQLVKN